MSDGILILIVGVVIVFGLVGALLGGERGRTYPGLVLGALFGPIGWIVVLLLPAEGRRCPYCHLVIPDQAKRCGHCTSIFEE